MKRSLAFVFLFLLFSAFFVSSVLAETKLDVGAAFRLRQEIWDDVVTFDTSNTGSAADRNFFRLRTQVWARADFNPSLGVYLRLTNEMKYFDGPFTNFKANNDVPVRTDPDRYDPDEVIFDNLYVDAKDVFGLPVDLRIGRQDFLGPNMYGEGFLLMDGTPGDGSRSFYFNAAKATWKINKQNSVDFVYIDDPETDTYLPSLHPAVSGGLFVDNKKLLTASREQALMVYARTKPVDGLTVEPYYIYKIENAFGATPKLKLNTIGARVVYGMNGGWNFGGEYAHQWGDYDGGRDRAGNGGYIFVGRKYENVAMKPEFDLRYIYLSGDKSDTDKNETWDPLFSRNPYWSELLIYSLPNETAKNGGPIPGYWSNMEILKATVKVNFDPATNLALSYQYIWAPESPVGQQGFNPVMFGTGKERGHLPIAILSHTFSKKVDGFLELEYFVPGSYYSDKADNATFFRWQLQFKI